MTSRSILLNKRRQSEKATYYMISTAQCFWKGKTMETKPDFWEFGEGRRGWKSGISQVLMILSLLGLLTLTLDWMIYTTNIYCSQYWRVEVWDQDESMVGFWWGHSDCLYSHTAIPRVGKGWGERERVAEKDWWGQGWKFSSSFYKGTNPIMRSPPSWHHLTLPKAPLSNATTWGVRT